MYFGSLKSFEAVTPKHSIAQTGDADDLKQITARAWIVPVSQLVLQWGSQCSHNSKHKHSQVYLPNLGDAVKSPSSQPLCLGVYYLVFHGV